MNVTDFPQLVEMYLKYGAIALLLIALGWFVVKKAASYIFNKLFSEAAGAVNKVLTTCDKADASFARLVRNQEESESRMSAAREQALADAANVFTDFCTPKRCSKILGLETSIKDLRHCHEALAEEVRVCKTTIQEFCREGRESREVTLHAIYEIKDAVFAFIREYARELIETVKALRKQGSDSDH